MASPVVDALAALGRALRALDRGWYLFGAQAALLYGGARLTADLDATVEADDADVAPLLSALAGEGFAPRVDDVAGFVARTRVLPLLHAPSEVPVDLVLAGPGLEPLFLSRARTHVVDGVAIPVAAPEDLVVMKLLAGRAKDLEDVAAVVAAQGGALDTEMMRTTLRSIEDALDRRDLLPILDEILSQRRR